VYDRARYPATLPAPLPSGMPLLIHISNFRAVKRVLDVVRIFAQVRRQTPCVLIMVGDGPDRAAAEEEARRLGVAAHVAFLGKIDAVAPLLAASHVFLLPSESESFGLSALEALACGVPVIASHVGGLPEVVQDGETGFLSPVGDINAMAISAHALLTDRGRWEAMSRRAAADARERFSRGDIVSQYEALYKETMRSSPSPSHPVARPS
jgi:N-acetyl-alpha-D-glucosaminyl L-malate synthase BshA